MSDQVNEAVRARPAPALRSLVAAYDGYRQRGGRPGRHRGLPSPYLTVIFTLDEPLHIAQHVDPRQRPGLYDSLVGGLHTAPALISHDGAQSGVQLRVSPLAARPLLGLPAGELSHIDLDGRDVLGTPAAEIVERLQEAEGWAQRFATLDRLLRQRVREGHRVPREVAYAWQRLLDTGGRMPVSQLAREVGWSERHLVNRFRTEVGLTPKAAARVTRFHRARRMLQAAPAAQAVADVAAECGYCDQSHLSREFTALAGCPPGQWLAEECGNVQAAAGAPEADCLA